MDRWPATGTRGCWTEKQVLPIQEDSTALILWALWIHYECARDVEFIRPLYEPLILKAADFLVAHRDLETLLPLPSYDLWEERYGVHTYTVASVVAGLRGAARFARLFHDTARAETYETAASQMVGRYREASLSLRAAAVCALGVPHGGGVPPRRGDRHQPAGPRDPRGLAVKDARVVETVEAVRRELSLDTGVGGVARYRGDRYQWDEDVPADVPGNPWFITTLWLGEYLIARAENVAELHEALPHLEWCARNALPSGVLAEQVHPVTGAPLSVSPLTWSHSAFVRVVLQYVSKRAQWAR